jgi:tight adherence protein B
MDTTALAVAILVAVTIGSIFYVFVYPHISGEARAEKRFDSLKQDTSQRRSSERIAELAATRKKSVSDSLKELESRELDRSKITLKDRIAQAGLTWTDKQYYLICVGAALLSAFVMLAISGNLIGAGLGLIVGGLGLPFWVLSYLRNRRFKQFIEEFPNAIDIIVRGIKSGLPLADCVRIIAAESREPLKSEFRSIVEAQGLGLTIGEAVARLHKRMPIQEANFFVIVIQIQQKAGGNLAEALKNLASVLRDRKRMRGKIQAMSMEAKASGAIVASTPFFIAAGLQTSSPGFLTPMFTTDTGNLMLLGAAFWMLCGVIVMRQMINFAI